MWYLDWVLRGVAIAAAARGAAIGAAAKGAAIGAPAMLVYVVIPPAQRSGSARAQARAAVRTAWKKELLRIMR